MPLGSASESCSPDRKVAILDKENPREIACGRIRNRRRRIRNLAWNLVPNFMIHRRVDREKFGVSTVPLEGNREQKLQVEDVVTKWKSNYGYPKKVSK